MSEFGLEYSDQIQQARNTRSVKMIITFFTRDGQFTTDKFATTEDARDYLDDDINPVMIQDIQSIGQDRAAIFIPNAVVSIFAKQGPHNSQNICDPELDSGEHHNLCNEASEYDHAVSFADAMIKK